MSPSWPKSAPNEESGVSADSRAGSALRCRRNRRPRDRDPPSSETRRDGHVSLPLGHAQPHHKRHRLPPVYSLCSMAPSQRCLRVASKVAKATPANAHLSHDGHHPRLYWLPKANPAKPHGPPRTHHQLQQPNHAGWERDGHFNDTSCLLVGMSEPGEKEDNTQLEEGSKLRESKRKPLQAWQLIKRKK